MAYEISFAHGVSSEDTVQLQEAFKEARRLATGEKNATEGKWFSKSPSSQLSSASDKGGEPNWFTSHYNSTSIGPSRRLQAIVEQLRKASHEDTVLYMITSSGDRYEVKKTGKLICTITACGTQAPTSASAPRDIVKKNDKDYVPDDTGILTRRFAYLVRKPDGSNPKVPELKPVKTNPAWSYTNHHPTGKIKTEWSQAKNRAVSALSASRDTWHTLGPKEKVCLAYLNYANNGKVGFCLSSTPKRVRDNPGVAFVKEAGHTIWRVDLSLIPTSVVLINLYARTPAEEHWKVKKKKEVRDGLWISLGTVKNRELFCSEIPQEAVKPHTISEEMLQPDSWSWKDKVDSWFVPETAIASEVVEETPVAIPTGEDAP